MQEKRVAEGPVSGSVAPDEAGAAEEAPVKEEHARRPKPAGALRFPAWAWPLLALPVVAAVGIWTYRTIAAAIEARLESTLQTMSGADAAVLGQWLNAEADIAEVLAADPRVRDDIASLVALARRTAGDPAALKASSELARLRATLEPIVSRRENAGFLVVDPGGLLVARSIDERIGDRVVMSVADGAAQALSGKRTFLAPTLKQRFASRPMAFVMVPVRDAAGAAIAVMGWRIGPDQVAGLLSGSRLGRTGESYAIDAEGYMVTESRFAEQVQRLGLLPAEAAGHTAAALEVRDPGERLAEGQAPQAPVKTRPLTWAVAEAVAGKSGVNARGYRNYLGADVVGAWQWLPEWGIGVVTEIEREEAYSTLATVRGAFRVLGGGLLLVAAAIAFSSRRIHGLQQEVQRAQRLGQYTLEDKIGEGGMGAVYRARHAFLRRPTAVKLIRSELASPSMLARFEREVQLTSQLTHANTIAIYDYGRTPEGVFYYAMEYLPGLPLETVIRDDGAQPEARVIHLLKQICASLAEAHRIGLVHRDIKPANIMICERGATYDVVKVLDFGLVKELATIDDSAVTKADHVVGTPLYMSPEGVIAAANVGPRSDVYAVGGVAYALVTGHQVFTGRSGVEIIGHQLHTAPIAPSERLGRAVDPFLERLILACLAKRPEERPADAGDLLAQIEAGWTGPAWTQADARAWWDTRAPAMLAARREAEGSVSRGPKLAVDVASRMRSRDSSQDLPELSIDGGTKTAVAPRVPKPPPQQ
jgi:serine/threonine protein kinase